MIRGTTPTLTFTFPFEKDEIKSLSVVFVQCGLIRLEKTLKDVEIENNVLTVRLSQEDTLCYWDNHDIDIQIRAVTNEGEAFASKIITTTAERILKDGKL
jgi:hypothetical protein